MGKQIKKHHNANVIADTKRLLKEILGDARAGSLVNGSGKPIIGWLKAEYERIEKGTYPIIMYPKFHAQLAGYHRQLAHLPQSGGGDQRPSWERQKPATERSYYGSYDDYANRSRYDDPCTSQRNMKDNESQADMDKADARKIAASLKEQLPGLLALAREKGSKIYENALAEMQRKLERNPNLSLKDVEKMQHGMDGMREKLGSGTAPKVHTVEGWNARHRRMISESQERQKQPPPRTFFSGGNNDWFGGTTAPSPRFGEEGQKKGAGIETKSQLLEALQEIRGMGVQLHPHEKYQMDEWISDLKMGVFHSFEFVPAVDFVNKIRRRAESEGNGKTASGQGIMQRINLLQRALLKMLNFDAVLSDDERCGKRHLRELNEFVDASTGKPVQGAEARFEEILKQCKRDISFKIYGITPPESLDSGSGLANPKDVIALKKRIEAVYNNKEIGVRLTLGAYYEKTLRDPNNVPIGNLQEIREYLDTI